MKIVNTKIELNNNCHILYDKDSKTYHEISIIKKDYLVIYA